MRLLVITARYPTPHHPAAGSFVQQRLAGADARVLSAGEYDRPGWQRYLALTWRALTDRGRYDGVEGHFVLPSGVVALLAARIRGLPLVVYAHGSDVGALAERNALMRWLARVVVRGADAVATNSTATAAKVERLGARAAVIPPGIDLSRFHPSRRPSQRRVLYLGGDAAYKGVEVARRLADTLAGPGLHEVAPDEIPDLIASHDVVLVPSTAEGYGLVAAEATASGRWVVASAVGGLPDVVRDGVTGTLVRDGDFAAALAGVPDYDPSAVAAEASRFDAAAHRRRMSELWESVLAARRAG